MSLVTRCPACSTLFKVVPDHIRVAAGWVRCGHCGEVFDASAYLLPYDRIKPQVVHVGTDPTSGSAPLQAFSASGFGAALARASRPAALQEVGARSAEQAAAPGPTHEPEAQPSAPAAPLEDFAPTQIETHAQWQDLPDTSPVSALAPQWRRRAEAPAAQQPARPAINWDRIGSELQEDEPGAPSTFPDTSAASALAPQEQHQPPADAPAAETALPADQTELSPPKPDEAGAPPAPSDAGAVNAPQRPRRRRSGARRAPVPGATAIDWDRIGSELQWNEPDSQPAPLGGASAVSALAPQEQDQPHADAPVAQAAPQADQAEASEAGQIKPDQPDTSPAPPDTSPAPPDTGAANARGRKPRRRRYVTRPAEIAPEAEQAEVRQSGPASPVFPETVETPSLPEVFGTGLDEAEQAAHPAFEELRLDVADEPQTVEELAPSFVAEAERRARWSSPPVRAVLGLALLLLAVGLAGQAALGQRDWLAARAPRLAPALQWLCRPLGCSVQPYRRLDAIVVDNWAVNRVGANGFRLSVTLRNLADLPVASPALELTLTDAQKQPLVRRVVTAAQLGAPPALPARGEFSRVYALTVSDSASPGAITDYLIEAFYP